MKFVPASEFIALFDPSVHSALLDSLRRYPDAIAMVEFENMDMCSSHLGDRSAMLVGPSNTYKSVNECDGRWLNDLPSQRKYANRWCLAEDLVSELTSKL